MKYILTKLTAVVFLLTPQLNFAQHCPPMNESYLSEISLKKKTSKTEEKDTISLNIEYTRDGRTKEAYQVYVLAYLEKDHDKLFTKINEKGKQPELNEEVVTVIHTQILKQKDLGTYKLNYSINQSKLAQKIITHRKLTDKDTETYGSWSTYKDNIRIAIFIPFLDDKKYSVLKDLPEDKHDCASGYNRFMLFQKLPYTIRIRKNPRSPKEQKKEPYWIYINGVNS